MSQLVVYLVVKHINIHNIKYLDFASLFQFKERFIIFLHILKIYRQSSYRKDTETLYQ